MSETLAPHADVADVDSGDRVVVVDLSADDPRPQVLEGVAAVIWRLLEEPRTEEELVSELLDTYPDAEAEQVRADVDRSWSSWRPPARRRDTADRMSAGRTGHGVARPRGEDEMTETWTSTPPDARPSSGWSSGSPPGRRPPPRGPSTTSSTAGSPRPG